MGQYRAAPTAAHEKGRLDLAACFLCRTRGPAAQGREGHGRVASWRENGLTQGRKAVFCRAQIVEELAYLITTPALNVKLFWWPWPLKFTSLLTPNLVR